MKIDTLVTITIDGKRPYKARLRRIVEANEALDTKEIRLLYGVPGAIDSRCIRDFAMKPFRRFIFKHVRDGGFVIIPERRLSTYVQVDP